MFYTVKDITCQMNENPCSVSVEALYDMLLHLPADMYLAVFERMTKDITKIIQGGSGRDE